MNAYALMAQNLPRINYTDYCDEYYEAHLSVLISKLELRNGVFSTSDCRDLEENALLRRIRRLFPRREMKIIPLELVNISGPSEKNTAIVLLQSLYNMESVHIKRTCQPYLHNFPEIVQCTDRLDSVNLITFITLGKLSYALGYSWTYVKERDALLRLSEYITIYHDRLILGWNPKRCLSEGTNGAVSTSMPARESTSTNASAPPSTPTQEINTTPSTPDTAPWGVGTTSNAGQGASVITDIDADDSFDRLSDDELPKSSN